MHSDNQACAVKEPIESFEAMEVVSLINLRSFQNGNMTLNDLITYRFRVPIIYANQTKVTGKIPSTPEFSPRY